MEKSEKALQRRIKQHIIAKEHTFFAIVHPGFEEIALKELQEIGIKRITGVFEGGVEFISNLNTCYQANLCSHTVTRILLRLKQFRAENFRRFGRCIEQVQWELYVKNGISIKFNITCRKSRLYHTGAIEEEFKKAFALRLKQYGIIPLFSPEACPPNKSQTIFLRIDNDICQLSMDTSGEALYKRGYKQQVTEAPLRETLASLILLAADINKYDTLLDPMCGSGTFSVEAGLMFLKRYPGISRDFIFQEWPAFRLPSYNYLKKVLMEKMPANSSDGNRRTIYCSDKDEKALAIARKNIRQAGLEEFIITQKKDFLKDTILIPEGKKAFIVLNPPYGGRIGDTEKSMKTYRRIGEKIRADYPCCGYAIIIPGVETEKILSLTYDKKIIFINGGIKVAVIIKNLIPSKIPLKAKTL